MAKTYIVWIQIEEHDDDENSDFPEYQQISENNVATFESEEAAREFALNLERAAADLEEP